MLAASLAMPLMQQVVTVPRPVLAALPAADFALLVAEVAPDATRPLAGTPAAGNMLPWGAGLLAVYVAVAGTMTLRLLVGVGLSIRMLRRARVLRLDGAHGLRVCVSREVSGPVTLGGTVLLPPDCEHWPEDRLLAVMAHESAHARAGDFYVLLLSRVSRALFWFSPVAWWLHARLAMLAEMASDDVAIAELGDHAGYASVLLDMARPARGAWVGVAMARPATVERRIERILAGGRAPLRAGGIERILAAGGVLCLTAIAAISLVGRTKTEPVRALYLSSLYRPVAIDPALLDRYAGYYRNAGNGSIMVVARDGDHLTTHRAGLPPVPEYPYTEHDFFLTTVPQQNTFVTDQSGAVVQVVHHQNGRDEVLDRIDADAGEIQAAAVKQRFAQERAAYVERPIAAALLDAYAGVYALSSRSTVTVTRRGAALDVQFNGRPSHEFHAYGERDFFSATAAAQISFVTGPDGRARAFVLHEGGKDRTAERASNDR